MEDFDEGIFIGIKEYAYNNPSPFPYSIRKANMKLYSEKISGYATMDFSEYVAESYASYMKGENVIDPELKRVFEGLIR